MPKANELIVQALEDAGIEYVFGIPGGGTGQIYDLLYGKEDRIKTILVRHEQAAAIMPISTDGLPGVRRWSWDLRHHGSHAQQLPDAGPDRHLGRWFRPASGQPVGSRGIRQH